MKRLRAILLAGFAALTVAAPAQADTWDVTGTGDGGTCTTAAHTCPSLRAAIAASEATKETADTINVPAGTININNDLVIQSDITVTGANARTTIIDGGFKYRGFYVSPAGNAKISHITVRNGAAGQAGSSDGGGILNFSGAVQLSYVRVTGSHADGRGGGIANYQGTLTLVNGLVDNNTASDGAGIANLGGVESPDRGLLGVAETTIFKNTAGAGGTGGISSRIGQFNILLLNRSTVADNVGGVRGVGGVSSIAGAAQAVGDVIARNTVAGEIVNCGDVRPTDSGFNVEDEKDCIDAGGGLTPGLATALRNEGGELDVLPLSPTSPAVDRMTASCTAGTLDARSLYRPQGPACDSGAYELDKAATVTITAGPTGTVTVNDVEFRFQASEPGPTVQCQLTGPGQGAGFTECYKSNAQPYADLADGPYTFSVRAADAAFPNPPVSTQSFIVNTGPPDTNITGGPDRPVSTTSATFSFTSSEAGSTFQCSLDGGAFGPCPVSYAGLAQGTHTFRVRAIDAAGTVDPTPASRSWTVDTVAPNAPVVNSPANNALLATNTVAFSGTAEPASTVELREGTTLTGSAVASGTGNWTIVMGAVPDGPHTYAARAIDAAANTSAATTRTVTVDTGLPDTSISDGPTGLGNDDTPTFTFSSEPGATFECSIDGVAHTACPNPYTTAALSQGAHTLSVRAVDAAGNRDNTPATRSFSVDSIAPAAPVIQSPAPNALLSSSTVTLSGSAEAGSTVQVREGSDLRGSTTATGGTWIVAVNNVPDGTRVYTARAVDAAGNVSAPTARTVRVDTGPPETSLDSGPAGPTNDTTPTFGFSSEPGATFECSVDGAAHAPCSPPFTTPALSQGEHTFSVRAVDSAGNRDATPASVAFAVDTVPPAEPAVVSGPSGPTTDSSPDFDFTSDPGTTVECRLDRPSGPGVFAPCESPANFAGLAPGDYTFHVRSTDAAGNSRTSTRAFTVTAPQQATPTPTPSPTPTPEPTPVPQQSVVVKPGGGTVLIRIKDSNTFEPLDITKGIPLGSEVDARKGRVELSAVPRPGAAVDKAFFSLGMFFVTQKGGVTDLKLSEKLTGCTKRARAAAKKKVKSRKLFGDGKGAFRTTGQYAAATVRGTKWLVQDTCTTTLVRVDEGVVQVTDFARKTKPLVKKGKRYTAKPKRR